MMLGGGVGLGGGGGEGQADPELGSKGCRALLHMDWQILLLHRSPRLPLGKPGLKRSLEEGKQLHILLCLREFDGS